MFYHFNNVPKNSELVISIKQSERICTSGQSTSTTNLINDDNKKSLNLSLSEKYQIIRDTNTSIRKIIFPLKSTLLLIGYILVFVAYLYIGAICFSAIEFNKERQNRENFRSYRKKFLQTYNCVSDSALEEFIEEIEKLTNEGVSPKHNASDHYNWDFPNAVFFVTTLVTTIGYGNDKPLTTTGKIFCIGFVLIGVPMMMVLTSAVVERLYLLIDLIFSAFFNKIKCNITEENFRRIQVLVCFSILLVFFVCIPAAIYKNTEGNSWSYLDAFYYCVISLTTIGLGDYVPGDSPNKLDRDLTKIFSTVYLFVGLLWTSFSIRIFHKFGKWNILGQLIYLENQNDIVLETVARSESKTQLTTNLLTYTPINNTNDQQKADNDSIESNKNLFPLNLEHPSLSTRIRRSLSMT